MSIRIDPNLTETGPVTPPPPTGSGGLSIHTAPSSHFNPAQEFINANYLAAITVQPSGDSYFADRDPNTNFPTTIPAGQTGFRFNHSWGDFTADNPVWGTYVVRTNLDPATYPLQLTGVTVLDDTDPSRIVIAIENTGASWRIDFPVTPGQTMPAGWYIETLKVANEAAYDNPDLPETHPTRVFAPEYLQTLADWNFVLMRMMKVMGSEGSEFYNYYPIHGRLKTIRFNEGTVWPLAVMIDLCNAFDMAPWFNLGYSTIDSVVDEFATYVRDNLKPSLLVYAACGNEYWNSSVYQASAYCFAEGIKYLGVKGPGTVSVNKTEMSVTANGFSWLDYVFDGIRVVAEGGGSGKNFATLIDWDGKQNDDGSYSVPPPTSTKAYFVPSVKPEYIQDVSNAEWWYNPTTSLYFHEGYTMLATKQMQRWQNIFNATGARSRLVNIWEGQNTSPQNSKYVWDSDYWVGSPDHVDPMTVFDSLSPSTYFGSGTFKDAGKEGTGEDVIWLDNDITAYLRPFAIADDYENFSKGLRDYMLDVPIPGVELSNRSVAWTAGKNKEWAAICKREGLRLLAYEGSAHIIHSVLNVANRPTDWDIVEAYRYGFRQSPWGKEVFQQWADLAVRFFDGPVMQFNLAQPISTAGAYGLLEFLGDAPDDVRQQVLRDDYVNRAPWWTEEFPPQWIAPGTTIVIDTLIPSTFSLADWASNNTTLFEGTPPAGLTLNTATGEHTGDALPSVAQDYTYTLTNAAGSIEVTVNIECAPQLPSWTGAIPKQTRVLGVSRASGCPTTHRPIPKVMMPTACPPAWN